MKQFLKATFQKVKKVVPECRKLLEQGLLVFSFTASPAGDATSDVSVEQCYMHASYVNFSSWHWSGLRLYDDAVMLGYSVLQDSDVLHVGMKNVEAAGPDHGVQTDLEFIRDALCLDLSWTVTVKCISLQDTDWQQVDTSSSMLPLHDVSTTIMENSSFRVWRGRKLEAESRQQASKKRKASAGPQSHRIHVRAGSAQPKRRVRGKRSHTAAPPGQALEPGTDEPDFVEAAAQALLDSVSRPEVAGKLDAEIMDPYGCEEELQLDEAVTVPQQPVDVADAAADESEAEDANFHAQLMLRLRMHGMLGPPPEEIEYIPDFPAEDDGPDYPDSLAEEELGDPTVDAAQEAEPGNDDLGEQASYDGESWLSVLFGDFVPTDEDLSFLVPWLPQAVREGPGLTWQCQRLLQLPLASTAKTLWCLDLDAFGITGIKEL